MIGKILVPIDGSEHSKVALEFACDLCEKFEAELHLVHVVRHEAAEHQVMVLGGAHVTLPADPELKAAGQSVLEAAGEVAESHRCPPSSSNTVAGSPAKEILAFAEESAIDAIVMGSRGLSDIGGLLLGSVSHKVSHLARCTCIVVRERHSAFRSTSTAS